MQNSYHPVVTIILNLLNKHNVWFETFEHEPVTTSEEAAHIRDGYSMSQGAKALIVKTKKIGGEIEFIMLVLPGDKKFDSAKVKKLLQLKEINFATPEEVATVTQGVQIGGVPPFGNLFKLKVYADTSLFQNEKIIFNAGDRRFSVVMKAQDYIQLVQPVTADLVKITS